MQSHSKIDIQASPPRPERVLIHILRNKLYSRMNWLVLNYLRYLNHDNNLLNKMLEFAPLHLSSAAAGFTVARDRAP